MSSNKTASAVIVDYAAEIKQIRSESGMLSYAFAKKVGVHATTLSRYERGKQAPSAETMDRIRKVGRNTATHSPEAEKQGRTGMFGIEFKGVEDIPTRQDLEVLTRTLIASASLSLQQSNPGMSDEEAIDAVSKRIQLIGKMAVSGGKKDPGAGS